MCSVYTVCYKGEKYSWSYNCIRYSFRSWVQMCGNNENSKVLPLRFLTSYSIITKKKIYLSSRRIQYMFVKQKTQYRCLSTFFFSLFLHINKIYCPIKPKNCKLIFLDFCFFPKIYVN